MNCTAEMLRLYAVTDRAWVGEQTLPQQVEAALKGGATCVQLREKDLGDAAILAEALEISALCKRYGVPFILNDNVALARQCGADGVHLGQEDMDPAEARRILGLRLTLDIDLVSGQSGCKSCILSFLTNGKR